MSWSIITAAEVLEELTPTERAMLENIQGADTQLASILLRVINAARGAISTGGNAVSETPGTIPDQVRSDVVSIARWKWLISFPTLKSFQTKERKDAFDDAMKRLDKIAEGTLKTEVPADPTSTSSLTPGPSFYPTRKRNFTRDEQEGL